MDIHDVFGRSIVLGMGNIRLDFGSDLRYDLDPGILFLLCLFLICIKLALVIYCLLCVRMPTIFITSVILILYRPTTVRTETFFAKV